jgi:BirA family biotin operon repressor/biotin-[acetyl-CoA-carboxylase] ligase
MNLKKRAKRIALKQVPSTNLYVRERVAKGKDCIVTAKRQTGGMGTKGRSFSSEKGGVYLTALRFYENLPAKQAFALMASAAVAVCETLESFGLHPVIKWANDIHANGKKICGILVENSLSKGCIEYSITGIGLNVCNPLPSELANIATTMYAETGKKITVGAVTRRLIKNLRHPKGVEEYLARLGYMGDCAELLVGEEKVPCRLLFVDSEGGLTVEINGETKRFVAAEVSLRL